MEKSLNEIAGRILAVKTIYAQMFDDFIRSTEGTTAEAGVWIHSLMIQALDEAYNDLNDYDKAINKN